MPANARKLAFYVAIGLSVLMVLFPPFTVSAYGGSGTEYGFLFSGPSSARQAMGAATMLGGAEGARMMGSMIQYHLDMVRLVIQFVIVWGLYVALVRTVLKTAAVALALALAMPHARAADLSYKTLFVVAMKLNPSYDYEAGADGYMQVFRPTVWQGSHNDEFEFEAKKKDTVAEMKRVVASTPAALPIVIHTQAQFGEYDFKAGKFAFTPFSENSRFTIGAPCCIQNNAAPSQFQLGFTNPGFVDGLRMPEEAAHVFLQHRKQYGNVNRTLQIDLTVVPKAVQGESDIMGEITRAVIRDDLAHGREIAVFPAS